MKPLRMHRTTRLVLLSLEVNGWSSGMQIARRFPISSGTLYPLLHRLYERGWVHRWEEVPRPADKPPQIFYKLTVEAADWVEKNIPWENTNGRKTR